MPHHRPAYSTPELDIDRIERQLQAATRSMAWRVWVHQTLRGAAICLASMAITFVVVTCLLLVVL
jgi:hypothetical protein